jgi:tetratricopeptide (TPR) repeat protein
VRAGDAGPGSLERRRREFALRSYIIIWVKNVLDAFPTFTLLPSDSLVSSFTNFLELSHNKVHGKAEKRDNGVCRIGFLFDPAVLDEGKGKGSRSMKKDQVASFTLIIFGAAIALGSITFWFNVLTSSLPQAWPVILRAGLTTLIGLAACIVGVVKYSREARQTPDTVLKGRAASTQIASGAQASSDAEQRILAALANPAWLDTLHQLPALPAVFTGREKELRALTNDLKQGFIISSSSEMPGIGKTALGLKLAHRLKKSYPDAQLFLDLRGASGQQPLSPSDAMQHVLHSFDREVELPENEATLSALYRSVLQEKRVLLFFDNACGPKQVAPLLPPPGCLLLVTSRQPFSLVELPLFSIDPLPPVQARKLVRRLARKINRNTADRLAGQCTYLPLALRLATGILKAHPDWSAMHLVETLPATLKQLRPVEACLDLSYALLGDQLKLHFRQLGVFPTAFDQAAAGAIWAIGPAETEDAVYLLLRNGLLELERASGRLYLREELGAFARAHLSAPEAEISRLRHARHYLQVLSTANSLCKQGSKNILTGLALFDREAGHIRTAQAWAAEYDPGLCNAFPSAGAYVLNLRLTPREKIAWLKPALVAARQLNDRPGEGVHLGNLGLANAALGRLRRAVWFYNKALIIYREIANRHGEAATLGNLGLACADRGRPRRAIHFYEKQLEIVRELGNPRAEGRVIGYLGLAYAALGETRKAILFHEKYLEIARAIADLPGQEQALANLGLAYADLGETRHALVYYEDRLEIAQAICDRRSAGRAFANLGTAYADLVEIRKSIESLEKHMEISREIGDLRGDGNARASLGNTFYTLGQKKQAVTLMRQALLLYQQIKSSNAGWVFNKLMAWGVQD